MIDWLPFGFALTLWFTGSPAMSTIWILSLGLGLIPSNRVEEAMIAVAILSVLRHLIAKAKTGTL